MISWGQHWWVSNIFYFGTGARFETTLLFWRTHKCGRCCSHYITSSIIQVKIFSSCTREIQFFLLGRMPLYFWNLGIILHSPELSNWRVKTALFILTFTLEMMKVSCCISRMGFFLVVNNTRDLESAFLKFRYFSSFDSIKLLTFIWAFFHSWGFT